MTKKVISIVDKLLPLTGRQVSPPPMKNYAYASAKHPTIVAASIGSASTDSKTYCTLRIPAQHRRRTICADFSEIEPKCANETQSKC